MKKSTQQLNEISFDDIKKYGHVGLDVVSIVSSLFPGVGTTVSIVSDLMNALWYYSEGKKVTAALYTIMAIPVVGDIFAIPIQASLKLGGKGLSKIPGVKQAMTKLIEKSPLVLKYLEKLVWFKATKPVAVSTKELLETMLEKVGKAGTEEEIEIAKKESLEMLEKALVKESGGDVSKVASPFTEKAAERLVVATKSGLKRIIPKLAGSVSDDSDISSTSGPTPKSEPGGRGSGKSCSDKKLKYGCKGNNVKEMQQKLLDCGYKLPRKGADGWFGPETRAAVKEFQTDNGLKVDGIVGKETLSLLGSCKQKKQGSEEKQPTDQSDTIQDTNIAPEPVQNKDVSSSTEPSSSTSGNLKSTPYWMTNIWKDTPQQDKDEKLKQSLIDQGYADETNWKERTKQGKPMEESKIQKQYYLPTIKSRQEEIGKLVFERLVKNVR